MFFVFLLALHIEALLEAINTSAGIYQLLLAGIERMAVGADFNTDILFSRAYLELVATCTLDGSGLVVGMDTLFHCISPRTIILSDNDYHNTIKRQMQSFF